MVRLRICRISYRLEQALGEVAVDAPVAHAVGIGQGAARDVDAQSFVIALEGLRLKAGLDVAQTLV